MGFFGDLIDNITGETTRRENRIRWRKETQLHAYNTRKKVIEYAYSLWVKKHDSKFNELRSSQSKLDNAFYLLGAVKQGVLYGQAVEVEKTNSNRARSKVLQSKQVTQLLSQARKHHPYSPSTTYYGREDEYIEKVNGIMQKHLARNKALLADWEKFHVEILGIYR